jgi:hypothetical protein
MSGILVISFVENVAFTVETEADSATDGKIPRICFVPEFGFIPGAVVLGAICRGSFAAIWHKVRVSSSLEKTQAPLLRQMSKTTAHGSCAGSIHCTAGPP